MVPRFQVLFAICLCGALLAGAGGAYLWSRAGPPVALAAGSYLSPARTLADFSLIDQHGTTFGPSNLKGRWSMMFFGYTNCPDLCPSTLTTLAALEHRLRAATAAVRPQVIFLSVDAQRDTPAQLANYVSSFDSEFIGVTASDPPALAAIAAKLGVGVIITPRADGSYSVDHSGAIFVINPDGRLAAVLTGPFSVDELQDDFRRIVAGRA